MTYGKYTVLTTPEELQKLDVFLDQRDADLYSVDTETNGLKFWSNLVIGLSFSFDSDSGFYIPFLEWIPDLGSEKTRKIAKVPTKVFERGCFKCVWTGESYSENVTNKEYEYPEFIVKLLKKWFLDSKAQLIMHNGPFDVLMIEHSFGFNLQDKLFVDTVLLKHVLDENTSNGLKETAILWAKELGFPAQEQANKEQREMGASVIRNGGAYGKRNKTIWRADLDVTAKYAIADTFLTFGLFEVGMQKLTTEYEPKHLDWFFEDEVMPLCREVVIPMRRLGVNIDVPYFEEMKKETSEKLLELEDLIIDGIQPHIGDFDIGLSVDEVATKKALVEQIIKNEGLDCPVKVDKKTGVAKKTFEKKAIQRMYAETGHWLWGYLLGEAEMPLSEADLKKVKQEIYVKKTTKPPSPGKTGKPGRRYQFNIGSDAHLRWLFCKKLGYDPKTLPQTDSATATKFIASMKAEVLKQFFLKNHAFVKPLLLYKKLSKLQSTYISPAMALHNNGVLHMDMVQSGTISGRFACRGGFNLQTLPKVEELSRCKKCGSKDIEVIHPIKLIAVMACNGCGHVEEDILCPSAIKAGFIAPPGYKIVNADYSSLEPRCFSFVSGDPKLKEIYQKNLDLYSKIYCDMEDHEGKYSPDPKAPNFLKKEAPALRDMVKPVVLGVPYGARAPQTAVLMKFKKIDKRSGKEILDVERGRDFREKYLNTYPELRRYMDGQDAKACAHGFVETLVGRRRHFKFTKPVYRLLKKAGVTVDEFLDATRKSLETQELDDEFFTLEALKKLGLECGFFLKDEKGVPRTWGFVRAMFKNELNNSKNMPIQGLAAHIVNRGMLNMTRAFVAAGLSARVRLTVHDEVTALAKTEEAEETSKILQHHMEHNEYTALVDVPMIAEPIICDNLKDSK